MPCCAACSGYPAAERQFGSARAHADLDRYRREGPDANSRLLLDEVTAVARAGDSLLDVGAGVGMLSFELLAHGLSRATLVDASPAFLSAARAEAERRGADSRVEYANGDFVQIGATVDPADVVVMHRVVCCYPGYASLLEVAATHARRLLVFSYPRDRWFIRCWMAVENAVRRARGNTFRTFVHSPAAMEAIVTRDGFRRIQRSRTFVWSFDVYARG
jgi:2-polyprenyl-3-methyl-5-hydroxy-6-metoxy-1,4-benzoquinol methylase